MQRAIPQSGGPATHAPETVRLASRELSQLKLFAGADLDALAPLLQTCPVRVLRIGEILVRAGDSCPALYLVLSGGLRAQDPASVVPDTLIRAGDSLGELFLLQDAVVAWTVAAVESTRVLVIEATAAWTLIEASHAIACNFLKLIIERARVGGTVAANEELRTSYKRHATLDESTGLHNRQWLDSILPRQIMRSAMSNSPLGLLLVEIDDFAGYSAQFGEAAADHACYAVAQTLINHVRPTDLLAFYGPAQFAVVLPDADLAGTVAVGERLRNAASEAVVLMSDESILPSITVSVGAVQYQAQMDPAEMLRGAEAQALAAKRSGGNRLVG